MKEIINKQKNELGFLTKPSVSCLSCDRSSNERQLTVGDKAKTSTSFRNIIAADEDEMRSIFLLALPFDCCVTRNRIPYSA